MEFIYLVSFVQHCMPYFYLFSCTLHCTDRLNVGLDPCEFQIFSWAKSPLKFESHTRPWRFLAYFDPFLLLSPCFLSFLLFLSYPAIGVWKSDRKHIFMYLAQETRLVATNAQFLLNKI